VGSLAIQSSIAATCVEKKRHLQYSKLAKGKIEL